MLGVQTIAEASDEIAFIVGQDGVFSGHRQERALFIDSGYPR
jgi:hypothetical protein